MKKLVKIKKNKKFNFLIILWVESTKGCGLEKRGRR